MRALLVNQFYPPDVAPTGQHLHELARCLVSRRHEVQVLCSRRSYEGRGEFAAHAVLDGVRVCRVSSFGFARRGAGRAADDLSFHLSAAAHALHTAYRYDLTLCLTTPPYVGWLLPRALGRRAGARAHWIMDLYPDVLAAHGALPAGGLVDRALQRLTIAELRGSPLVVTPGERMQAKVRRYTGAGTRVECVPLWSALLDIAPPEAAVASWREARGWRPGDCVLLYSGNMGLGHRLEEFLEGAARTADPSRPRRDRGPRGDGEGHDVVWAFAGGGLRRSEVERFVTTHPGARVQLLPYSKQEDVAASLSAGDVHLVSLRGPWQGIIVPSKLQAAFGLGRPVIFVGPPDCEPADWIAASGGGWLVGEGDVEGLLRAVDAARDPAERRRRGEAARGYARAHFDRETNTRDIAELLEEVAQSRELGAQT